MSTEIQQSTLPHDLEIEKALLGSLIRQSDFLVDLSYLTPDVFYSSANQKIFSAIQDLFNKDQPIDDILIANHLSESNLLNDVGGYGYLSELTDSAHSPKNVTYYAKIINKLYQTREIIRISNELIKKGRNPSTEIAELLETAEKQIVEIALKSKEKQFYHIKEINPELIKELNEKSKIKDDITGIASGFGDLDKITAGFQSSDLIILAARPSMGKTALALNFAQYATLNKKKSCLIFSLEMSKEQLALRLLSADAQIESQALRKGNLNDNQMNKISKSLNKMNDTQLFINDTPGITTHEFRAIAKQVDQQLDDGLSLIVVDYLQLMRSTGRTNNREQEISDISRTLKHVAKELNVPVMALAQLNRQLESRTDKRPMMSDLRESGSIEQDADIIMFIYRDEIYNQETEDIGLAELNISKHRNGSTGKIMLHFQKQFTKFSGFVDEKDLGI